ncbi:MAG TPA: peptidase S53, partial [Ktedonobacteraceae bacterium]
ANDWLFAEGYTGGRFQENFVLANLDPARTSATVTITLEYDNGTSHAFTVTVNALSQVIWNVNTNGTGATSQSVSAEITSSGANIVVQREMFFGYNHAGDGRTTTATGGTDVLGQVGPASVSNYSFAEGYTNLGYDEWLTIQNPTANPETITATVANAVGTVYTFSVQVGAHSRYTVDMVATVIQHMFHPNDGYNGYEISLAVQSSSGPFVVERPMYWNASGTQGGSDVIGFSG